MSACRPDRVAHLIQSLEIGGRRFTIVGTAHVSRESVELVRRVLEEERPDRVCVELDERRYEALIHRRRWESLDLKEVIRKGQLATLLMSLLLASYQRRLGKKLGVVPGMELAEAVRVAEEQAIPVSLCDRDIRVTLRRAWQSVSIFKRLLLVSTVVASAFDKPDIDEQKLAELMKGDVLSEVMRELGEIFPSLKRVLIDERDSYIAQKMKDSPGERVVAVVGAGHVEGLKAALSQDREVSLASLDVIPPVSPVWKWIGWGVPASIIAAICYIGWSKGPAAAGDNVVYWILANGIPSSLGALVALAHPVTVVTAFVAAPVTSLTPVIGAGYVTGFVQAYVRPPLVHEFETVMEDVFSLGRWWRSRLLRIFLAFMLPGIGSLIGTFAGGVEIFSNLFD